MINFGDGDSKSDESLSVTVHSGAGAPLQKLAESVKEGELFPDKLAYKKEQQFMQTRCKGVRRGLPCVPQGLLSQTPH